MDNDDNEGSVVSTVVNTKEKPRSVVDAIRRALQDAEEGGGGMTPQEILIVPKDGVKKVRFLSEFDQASEVIMHDKFGVMYPQPCLKYYKEACPFDAGGVRTKTHYVWTVYDYESATRKLTHFKANLNSPVEGLIDLFEMNGTITDRDVELKKSGNGPKTRVRAKPLTKEATPFVGKVSKPFTEEKVFEIMKGLIIKRDAIVPVQTEASGEEEEE